MNVAADPRDTIGHMRVALSRSLWGACGCALWRVGPHRHTEMTVGSDTQKTSFSFYTELRARHVT